MGGCRVTYRRGVRWRGRLSTVYKHFMRIEEDRGHAEGRRRGMEGGRGREDSGGFGGNVGCTMSQMNRRSRGVRYAKIDVSINK